MKKDKFGTVEFKFSEFKPFTDLCTLITDILQDERLDKEMEREYKERLSKILWTIN
jgi:hypothetical protein